MEDGIRPNRPKGPKRVIAAAFCARNHILAMSFTNVLHTLKNIVFCLGTSPMGVIGNLNIVNLKIQAYSP